MLLVSNYTILLLCARYGLECKRGQFRSLLSPIPSTRQRVCVYAREKGTTPPVGAGARFR
jgi:hypothetical protein